MKKTIALALALVLTLSLVAMPASAAARAILNGYCTHCENRAEVHYEYYPIDTHYYVTSCAEYLEPHYHSSSYRSCYLVCATPNCVCEGEKVYIEENLFYDECNYDDYN